MAAAHRQPRPDGTQLHLSFQRGPGVGLGRGVTYEVSGPFLSPG